MLTLFVWAVFRVASLVICVILFFILSFAWLFVFIRVICPGYLSGMFVWVICSGHLSELFVWVIFLGTLFVRVFGLRTPAICLAGFFIRVVCPGYLSGLFVRVVFFLFFFCLILRVGHLRVIRVGNSVVWVICCVILNCLCLDSHLRTHLVSRFLPPPTLSSFLSFSLSLSFPSGTPSLSIHSPRKGVPNTYPGHPRCSLAARLSRWLLTRSLADRLLRLTRKSAWLSMIAVMCRSNMA